MKGDRDPDPKIEYNNVALLILVTASNRSALMQRLWAGQVGSGRSRC